MRSFQKGIFLALCGLPIAIGYTCPSILVGSEDTCDTLAVKCGISAASFASLNPKIACSSLAKGKPVCCELGEPIYPPDSGFRWCYTYTVRQGDTCAKIAEGYKVTEANIEAWNTNTTAWYGCNNLQDGGQVCLDKAEPPMPVAIGDAVCGPQVPGTARPRMPFMIPTLNPCPAGQCCSNRGQCGTGDDFCGSGALAVPAWSANMGASAPADKATSESSTKDASQAKVASASKATSAKTTSATKAISVVSSSATGKATSESTNKDTKAASASEATSAKTTKTSSAPSSSTTKATSVKRIASVAPKSLSTSTKNKDPHFFTTDIPLVDIPLTYYHPSTTESPYPIAGTEAANQAIKVINHLLTLQKGSTATTNATSTATTVTQATSTTKSISTTKVTTTKATSDTASKETTKTNARKTKTVSGIPTVPSGWELRMWSEPDCKGSQVLLQGHNVKLEDSECMKFRYKSDLKTDVNDESVSCRYWQFPEGANWQFSDCHRTNLNKPKSWRMSNGLCTVSPNTNCDLWNDVSQTYGWRGPGKCQNRTNADPETFGSFKCYVG